MIAELARQHPGLEVIASIAGEHQTLAEGWGLEYRPA
jgi:hypothetical protein